MGKNRSSLAEGVKSSKAGVEGSRKWEKTESHGEEEEKDGVLNCSRPQQGGLVLP